MESSLDEPVEGLKRRKRIVAIDFGRGFGLFIVLITHLANYWGFPLLNENPNTFGRSAVGATAGGEGLSFMEIILFPFQILGSWASVFALLTGASTAYTMYHQILEKKIKIKTRLKQSLLNGVILLTIHFIYTYFVIYPTSNELVTSQGLIPLSIKNGKISKPPLQFLILAGPLSMIAFSDFFVVWGCALLWQKKGWELKYLMRNVKRFIVFGTIIVLSTELMRAWLLPVIDAELELNHYGSSLLLTWLVGTKHAIFPFVGFAFFGASIGLLYHIPDEQESYRKIGQYTYSFGAVFFVIGIISVIINGFPVLVGLYHPFFLYIMNLSLQLFLAGKVARYFDFIPMEERKSKPRYRNIFIFRRFSILSLTLFMTEETIAAIYTRASRLVFGDWIYSLPFLLFVWLPIEIFAWIRFVDWWEQHNFKYSLEWFIAALTHGKSVHTNEDLLHVEENIYLTSGYSSRADYIKG